MLPGLLVVGLHGKCKTDANVDMVPQTTLI